MSESLKAQNIPSIKALTIGLLLPAWMMFAERERVRFHFC